jgi:hypothetical protein
MTRNDQNENLTQITINVQYLADSGFDLDELMNALYAQIEDAHGVKTFRAETYTETDIWGTTNTNEEN